MLTYGSGTGIKRKADVVQKQILYFHLCRDIIESVKSSAVRLRRCEDFAKQREKSFFQFFKNTVNSGRIHSLFVLIEQYFVGILSGIGVSTFLRDHGNQLFQIRCKQSVVGRSLCLRPCFHGLILQADQFFKESLRDAAALFKLLL